MHGDSARLESDDGRGAVDPGRKHPQSAREWIEAAQESLRYSNRQEAQEARRCLFEASKRLEAEEGERRR